MGLRVGGCYVYGASAFIECGPVLSVCVSFLISLSFSLVLGVVWVCVRVSYHLNLFL